MEAGKDFKITNAITLAAGAAGTTSINGTILDMQNYESVLIIVETGPIVSGAVTTLKAQQDSASAMGGAQDLLGTELAVADTDDDKAFYLDIIKPTKRYVRVVVPRATQNATLAAVYVQYNGSKSPVTHGTNVTGETHVSPAEGTA